MKILLLSTSDINGGGPKAAFRLNEGLNNIGMQSRMMVQTKLSDDTTIIGPETKISKLHSMLNPHLDQLLVKIYNKRKEFLFSPAIVSKKFTTYVNAWNPDLINLHWVGLGYLRVETIKSFTKPLVWTLHDSWAFTGGCHYSFDCIRYRQSCGKCPALGSVHEHDLSKWIWWRKKRAWKDLDLTLVAPSRWMAEMAGLSSLFNKEQIKIIPNGLDVHKYKPVNKQTARHILSLPIHKKLIMFGAFSNTTDHRKGFHLLLPALKELANNRANDIELVVLGTAKPEEPLKLGMKVHYMGRLYDDVSIAMLYSAVDAFVAPSIEDNLPNTIMEALACGTPCIAFNVGGMPDLIEHGFNGYLARPFEPDSLAKGIAWVLEDNDRWHILSHRARQKVENEFTLEIIAKRYADVYQEILSKAK